MKRTEVRKKTRWKETFSLSEKKIWERMFEEDCKMRGENMSKKEGG